MRCASSPRPASTSTSRRLEIAEPRLSADEPPSTCSGRRSQERRPWSSSTTSAPAAESRHPAPPAVGRGPLLRPLVRRRARHSTGARSGSSGSRASRRAGRSDPRARTTYPPAPTCARSRPARAPARPSRATPSCVRHGAGHLRRARRRGRRRRSDGPTRGTGWCSTAAGWARRRASRLRADVLVESPPELREATCWLAAPMRPPRGSPRPGAKRPGRPAADPGAVPAPHGEVASTRRPRRSGVTPSRWSRTSRCCSCAGCPGGYPDDLIDVDLDALETERADGVIRVSNADYLARPLRLTPDRGDRDDRGAAALRSGRRRRHPRGRRPALAKLETAAAGLRATHRPRSPPRRRRGAGCARRSRRPSPRPPGPADLLRAGPRRGDRAGRRPAGWSAARGLAYLDAWCHSAEAPGCSGSTGSTSRRSSTPRRTRAAAPPPRPGRRAFTARRTTLVTSAPAPGPLGGRVLPGRGGAARSRRHLEVDLLVADERWLTPVAAALGAPYAPVIAARRLDTDFRATAARP